jgi:hypothetical protein
MYVSTFSPEQSHMQRYPPLSRFSALALIVFSLTATACSMSGKPPYLALKEAEQAIVDAERAQVMRYTSSDLSVARSELNRANQAVIDKKMTQASYYAKQAQLSAELALIEANLIKAMAVNQEMEASILALKRETARNTSGDRQ